MPLIPPDVTNAQADRAANSFRSSIARMTAERAGGQIIRPTPDALDALARALSTIVAYRAMHAYPLRRVSMGVRVMTETELGADAPRPGQRFKRLDRMLEKIMRFPTMRLSQMEDIGGCRVVLESLDDMYAVAGRLRRRWPHSRLVDHVVEPKADGYRGVHVVEKRDGRLIEVQLRTARQNDWAQAVEDALSLTGFNVKDGHGPEILRRYFVLASARLALKDEGSSANSDLEQEFAGLREQVRPLYRRRDDDGY